MEYPSRRRTRFAVLVLACLDANRMEAADYFSMAILSAVFTERFRRKPE